MATATTPTRRAASRSAAPSSSRSSRSNQRALSRGDVPSSPLARIIDSDIPIDPALLGEEDGDLQDDLDAEGEVDDGVGYYMPAEEYYYPPAPPLADAYNNHHPPHIDTAPPVYLPDMPLASSSSQLAVPPPANGHSYQPTPTSLASASPLPSPLSATSDGVVVKRKRGRPRKDPNAPPKPKTTTVTPRQSTPRAVNGTLAKPQPSLAKPTAAVTKTPRQPKMSSTSSTHLQVTPVQQLANGSRTLPITPETICSLCGGTDVRNREGNREKMVSCVKCGRSGHPSCLGITNPEVVKKMRSYAWCCIECKPCEVCLDKGEDHKLLFCDGCDRGWHSYCLNPPLSAPPKGMWYCPMCSGDHKPTPSSSKSSLKASSATPVPTSASRKGKGRAVEEDTPKPSAPRDKKKAAADAVSAVPNGSTPKIKQKLNGVRDKEKDKDRDKGKEKERVDKDRDGDKDKKDRKRPRVQSPSEEPPTPTGIVVRLRVPSGSRKEVQVEEEEEQVPYGGVITGEDADQTNTKIQEADKELYNKALKASEARLGGPPPPLWDPQAMMASPAPPSRQSTPGPPLKATPSKATPSRATPAKATPAPTPTPGSVTPLAGSRSLRDRVLLQQSASLSGAPGASGTDSPSSGRPEKISKIRFGIYDIDTWYTAPYPEEYAQVPDGRLWLCEFCLKYMKSGFVAGRHRMKCKSRHPPGDEIYRDGAISVFEVDGRKNKIYCQNLCLLAKMFLDHKTLYYDVEPFLFYVMTEVDEMGARFVGYFSKEKRTPQNNVSCIMTLPVRQRKGWGQLLIDFSYLLSKKEGRVGSPERPLSGLGALSYKSYWKLTVFKYLSTATGPVTMEDISAATSMTIEDIYATLLDVQMIKVQDAVARTPIMRIKPRRGRPPKIPRPVEYIEELPPAQALDPNKIPERYEITPDMAVIDAALQKHNAKGYLTLKPERLKYTPFLVSRDPLPQPPIAAAVTGDRVAAGEADRPRGVPSETPSSGNKEVIATPAEAEIAPITPDTKDKVAAGEDQATLDLVAALSASPVRHLRRRSIASSERPAKRRRSESTTSSRRRSTNTQDLETPTRSRNPKPQPAPRSRRKYEDPDDEPWGEEDAEGEDDDEEYVEVDDDDD